MRNDVCSAVDGPGKTLEARKNTMANRTDPLAKNVHGTNPQFLLGKIVRSKVHDSAYWKENCFGLTGTAKHNF